MLNKLTNFQNFFNRNLLNTKKLKLLQISGSCKNFHTKNLLIKSLVFLRI